MRVSSLPTWAIWSIAAAAVLMDAGMSVLLPLAVGSALGWLLLRLRSRSGGKASARM